MELIDFLKTVYPWQRLNIFVTGTKHRCVLDARSARYGKAWKKYHNCTVRDFWAVPSGKRGTSIMINVKG